MRRNSVARIHFQDTFFFVSEICEKLHPHSLQLDVCTRFIVGKRGCEIMHDVNRSR